MANKLKNNNNLEIINLDSFKPQPISIPIPTLPSNLIELNGKQWTKHTYNNNIYYSPYFEIKPERTEKEKNIQIKRKIIDLSYNNCLFSFENNTTTLPDYKVIENYSNLSFIEKEKIKYTNYSIKKIQEQNDYIKYIRIYNKKKDYLFKLNEITIENKYKAIFNIFKQKSFCILDEAIDNNLESCLFITFSLNSQFHKYSNKGTILNKDYNVKNTINRGYKILNKTFRNIQKQIAMELKGQSYKFIKVFEPHKDYTPHAHIILYVNKENTNHIINIILNKINGKDDYTIQKINVDEKEKINNKTLETYITPARQDIRYNINFNAKNNIEKEIGRTTIDLISNNIAATNYLIKYIQKMMKSERQDIDGWKRKNKIQMFRTSNTHLPLYVYTKLYNQLKKNLNDINKVNKQNIKSLKEELLEDEINFMTYFKENTNIQISKTVYTRNTNNEIVTTTKIKDILENNNADFEVYIHFNIQNKIRRIENFIIFFKGNEIFNLDDYYTFIIKKDDILENDNTILNKYYFNKENKSSTNTIPLPDIFNFVL